MGDIEFLDVDFERGKCIIVPANLYGCPISSTDKPEMPEILSAILDTGASSTHISKKVLLEIGYSEKDFFVDTKTSLSVTGQYTAMMCKVRRIGFCGLTINNFDVKVWEPPANYHVTGIIGMNLLRHYNIHINSDSQRATINHSNATVATLKNTQKGRA